MEKKVTITLSPSDLKLLLLIMGFAAGARSKASDGLPSEWKELTDWVLIQSAENSYTYWHKKDTLRERKEAELAAL